MELFFIKAFTTLFIVIDPLGCLPIFITLTSGQSRSERRKTALKSVITAFVILFFFSIAGKSIFTFFGTSMGAFQVAGGMLLFLIAMNMLKASRSGLSQTISEEMEESKEAEDVSLVPIALPLLAGPSAIASVVVLVEESHNFTSYLAVVASIFLALTITYLIFRVSGIVFRVMGKTGLFLVMRLMGLILAAVSIQFIVDGIKALFPFLKAVAKSV